MSKIIAWLCSVSVRNLYLLSIIYFYITNLVTASVCGSNSFHHRRLYSHGYGVLFKAFRTFLRYVTFNCPTFLRYFFQDLPTALTGSMLKLTLFLKQQVSLLFSGSECPPLSILWTAFSP